MILHMVWATAAPVAALDKVGTFTMGVKAWGAMCHNPYMKIFIKEYGSLCYMFTGILRSGNTDYYILPLGSSDTFNGYLAVRAIAYTTSDQKPSFGFAFF